MSVLPVMRGCPYYNSSVAVVCLVCPNCGQKFCEEIGSKISLSKEFNETKIAIKNVKNVAVHATSPPLL